jgi:ABC-type nitrate/sulfonate/bicarbonate transport system ATPase subunit
MSHASVPMTDSEPLLAVEDLHVAYGKTAALHGVNLRIDRGETVALIGANGAGKSTTLRTISGLLAPARGRIRFKGASIAGCRPDQIVRQGIAHSPCRWRRTCRSADLPAATGGSSTAASRRFTSASRACANDVSNSPVR